jgi:hypothetical protein
MSSEEIVNLINIIDKYKYTPDRRKMKEVLLKYQLIKIIDNMSDEQKKILKEKLSDDEIAKLLSVLPSQIVIEPIYFKDLEVFDYDFDLDFNVADVVKTVPGLKGIRKFTAKEECEKETDELARDECFDVLRGKIVLRIPLFFKGEIMAYAKLLL